MILFLCQDLGYIVIYNDKILDIVPHTTGIEESFNIIDDVLFDAVHGLCEIILNYKKLNINVDFADISTTLTNKGLALIGIGHQKGENSAIKALKEAITSPLLNIDSINRAKSIIVHFTFNPKFPIHKMSEVMHQVKNSADLGAKCIVGTVYDKQMQEDEVKVTLIATGFDEKNRENLELKKEFSLPKKEESIEKNELSNIRIQKPSWLDKLKNWF